MSEEDILEILKEVKDPEIPVLSLVDLGVVREIKTQGNGKLVISITPTYSGCPAVKTMKDDIVQRLVREGVTDVEVKEVIKPAWTTDWISDDARKRLLKYGIAPPVDATEDKASLMGDSPVVACPQCGSKDTRMISQFGSTACKALYQCNDCKEPFDYFKCLK
jgi:ring-1,2-phenylacetyl-CoA epoxidase subunit PaaD